MTEAELALVRQLFLARKYFDAAVDERNEALVLAHKWQMAAKRNARICRVCLFLLGVFVGLSCYLFAIRGCP